MSDTNVKAGAWPTPQPMNPEGHAEAARLWNQRYIELAEQTHEQAASQGRWRTELLSELDDTRTDAHQLRSALRKTRIALGIAIALGLITTATAGWQGWRAGLAAGYNQGYDQGLGVTISDHSSIDGLLGPILTDPATGLQAARFDLEASDRPDGL